MCYATAKAAPGKTLIGGNFHRICRVTFDRDAAPRHMPDGATGRH
jgi:hypothetical protein